LHAKDKKLSHENVEKEEKVEFYDSVSSYSEVTDFLASFITDSEKVRARRRNTYDPKGI